MKLANAQKSVISNIFKDLTKLAVAALVIGQFVPGQIFRLPVFLGGLITAVLLGVTAVISAVDKGGIN
ncbi:MAG: hypothetical protein KKA31_00785 [Candidatus Margulisbacteria bacterium]|nr:hypothetical protein [Candidatus Margulisiibacteriota bacterium]